MRNFCKIVLIMGLVISQTQAYAGFSNSDPPQTAPQTASNNRDETARAYLAKYLAYEFWVLHLPDSPQPDFIQFIEPTTPLTQKLREKWLYRLAEKQDWVNFQLYYRPTDNTGLRCYAQIAQYKGEQKQAAIQNALHLWLSPETQVSTACQKLFTLLQQEHAFSTSQMTQKMAQALAQNHSALAYALLLRMGPSYTQELKMLTAITRNPKQILLLEPGPLAGALALYGLNLLLSRSLDSAITFWQTPQIQKCLSTEQSQQFLAHLALYKTMRNQKDAGKWLAKVSPQYRDPVLRDWGIRYALMQNNWQEILQITEHINPEKSEPFQIYWRARALDKVGQHTAAQNLYRILSPKRHYYGFLASIALHQKLQFEAEPTTKDLSLIAIYKPITDQIAEYYRTKQTYLAAHMLNEFSMELSKSEKSALVYWVATHLHWPGKAIYLSTTDEVLKNQLTLRFPLNYQSSIEKLASHYHISSALIYAIIRQESTFFEDIRSGAGACGLMQILPRTAKTIAKQEKIPFLDAKELFHPEKNIQIGVAYLNTLHRQFKAHPVLIMAAYNAGPKQVRNWVTRHSPKEIDIWIETLPWQETRNYLKNMISFYAVYQYRMQQKPNLSPFLQPF